MILDIIFDSWYALYNIPSSPIGGIILGYSMDGNGFDFEQTINNISIGENSFTFIT
jgi:hypothetical protein